VIAEDIPGFTSVLELETIARIAQRVRPRTVVEIGSWAGRTAVAWAEGWPDAVIYCIDPWDSIHHYLGDGGPAVSIYFSFLKYTAEFPNIRGIRCRSEELKLWYKPVTNLVFIDGDHSAAAVRHDLILSHELTRGRGVICGHDYNNPDVNCTEVQGAVDAWAKEYGYDLRLHSGTYIFELTNGGQNADQDGEGSARDLQGLERG
jgi:hypothetical protein